KLADIALWRVDGFHAAVADPVIALVFGATPPLARLYVHGRAVVEDGELRTADQEALAAAGAAARRRMTGDQMTGDQMTGDQMTGDQMSRDQMSRDQMSRDQMTGRAG
ncbi:MAG TPA: hypothetical protein VF069_21790, partial [Streptosporangiaceae bacterium]